jgi:hypothetical protein
VCSTCARSPRDGSKRVQTAFEWPAKGTALIGLFVSQPYRKHARTPRLFLSHRSLVANIRSGLHCEHASSRRYAYNARLYPFSRPSGEKGYVHS